MNSTTKGVDNCLCVQMNSATAGTYYAAALDFQFIFQPVRTLAATAAPMYYLRAAPTTGH
jgi:hypothetical protein